MVRFRDRFKDKINYAFNGTIMKANLSGMRELAKFAIEMGGKEITFWPLAPNPKHLDLGPWIVERGDRIFDYERELLGDQEVEIYKRTVEELRKEFSDKIIISHATWKSPQVSKKEPRECFVPITNRLYHAHGGAKHCCYQTKPLFNWREDGKMDFEDYEIHHEVISSLAENKIPVACSRAACEFVDGRISDEIKENHHPVDFRINKIY